MLGATLDEFKDMLANSWEIDFNYKGHEFHYQRNALQDSFDIYLSRDGEYQYEASVSDMKQAVADILTLTIFDGLTLEEAEEDIKVISEA